MSEKEAPTQHVKKLPAIILAKRIFYILLITAFFWFLALFPDIGYSGWAKITHVEPHSSEGYIIVDSYVDVTFNPVFYPLSWFFGKGHVFGPIKTISVMEHAGHWILSELADEVVFSVMLAELIKNLMFLLILVTAIEIIGERKLHLCLIAGAIGFHFASYIGAFIGLFVGGFLIFFLAYLLEKRGYVLLEGEKREGFVID
jgi:hypothetical protein